MGTLIAFSFSCPQMRFRLQTEATFKPFWAETLHFFPGVVFVAGKISVSPRSNARRKSTIFLTKILAEAS